jgi:hypothetical protein
MREFNLLIQIMSKSKRFVEVQRKKNLVSVDNLHTDCNLSLPHKSDFSHRIDFDIAESERRVLFSYIEEIKGEEKLLSREIINQ